ncbi:hypothetical protein K491DRAFT_58338 [Lophiostoma macrostomum CBS 122681]|uniref:Uncharacterized protein n=1 Tax=Lophiostoma macrostomum CBS 122681 TaxID=1314788 RepID=A0A6A6TMM1_9PLEO|nr:hypothetical protein K491DRAFT_58338 [Lophiostoma macrostomum CBS 122681]
MAGGRAEHDSRYHHNDDSSDERDRERRAHRRHRHRHREYDDDYSAAKRERRERRKADEARRAAELDIDELRARRASYFDRPEPERRRESQRMAQEVRVEREPKARSGHREVRRDGTRRRKTRERVDEDRSDDYVYSRPRSRGPVEEVTVKRSSTRRRSDEGGSSSRTAHTPPSGSRATSARRVDAANLSRSFSARDPARVYMASRPSLRRTSTLKLSAPTASPMSRGQSVSVRDQDSALRKSTGGLLGALFRPPPRTPTALVHKEVRR